MKTLLILTILTFAASQSTTPRLDSDVYQQMHAIFNSVNFNHDGAITQDEGDAYFDDMDTNGDGKVDFDEFLSARTSPLGPRGTPEILEATFLFYDKVGGTEPASGFVLRNETSYFFGLIDGNGDGRSTLAEFNEGYQH
ncbi:hypothetical protein BaRGS_00016479, partial [Batillaria attramentaria]